MLSHYPQGLSFCNSKCQNLHNCPKQLRVYMDIEIISQAIQNVNLF